MQETPGMRRTAGLDRMLRGMAASLTHEQLEAAYAVDPGDVLPGRPQMSEFRQRTRYHQARWREVNGHPIGTQPIVPRPGAASRPVGNRVPFDYGRETGANFITRPALEAARQRTSFVEPEQSFDHQRFWAELLWAPSTAFNLFGDLWADPKLADRAVHTWWPDTPGRVSEVRFAHSPGRLDPAYLNSLRAWDAAFILDQPDGTRGILAMDVNYYEWAKPEIPKPQNRKRNLEVADRSRAFQPDAYDVLLRRSAQCLLWLEHLLLLSMLQHSSRTWSWGRFVVLYPVGNVDYAQATARYRELLEDESTFGTMTLEDLLDARALPPKSIRLLRDRYITTS
jgi:hypothetical protein